MDCAPRRWCRRCPVRRIVQSHQRRAAHGAKQLRRPEVEQLRIVSAEDRSGQRDGRIQIRSRTSKCLRDQHAAQHGQSPSGGDDHPSRVGRVGFAQRYTGIHAVAQQHQHQRAQKLTEPDRMHCSLPCRCAPGRGLSRGWSANENRIYRTQAFCTARPSFAKCPSVLRSCADGKC
jgi:hypothetical protein